MKNSLKNRYLKLTGSIELNGETRDELSIVSSLKRACYQHWLTMFRVCLLMHLDTITTKGMIIFEERIKLLLQADYLTEKLKGSKEDPLGTILWHPSHCTQVSSIPKLYIS